MSRNSVACIIQFPVLLGYDVKYSGGSDIFAVSGPGDHAKIDTIMNYAKYQDISEQRLVKRGFKHGCRLSFLKNNDPGGEMQKWLIHCYAVNVSVTGHKA